MKIAILADKAKDAAIIKNHCRKVFRKYEPLTLIHVRQEVDVLGHRFDRVIVREEIKGTFLDHLSKNRRK